VETQFSNRLCFYVTIFDYCVDALNFYKISLHYEWVPRLKAMRQKLTQKPLQLGFLYVPKSKADLFPSIDAKLIVALNSEKEVELTYNAKYRRLHGLTEFYRKNDAQLGDVVEVEVVDPLKKYRISLEKSPTRHELVKPSLKKRKAIALVGPPINFRGLMYAPVNENGVIFLFSKVAEDLGIKVEGIQVAFPDAFGKRYEKNKGYPVTIEFEYKSSAYKRHGHPEEGCDLLVCWEHDWKQCPMQVIELKSLIKKLSNK